MVDVELNSFNDFKVAALKDYDEIKAILSTPLREDPHDLADDLAKIEAWGSRISYLLAKADGYLDMAESQRLLPKDPKQYSDLDREKHLAAACAKERVLRDLLESMSKGISSRIMLGMSNLGVMRAEIERGLRQ